jgi:hypothetical protein
VQRAQQGGARALFPILSPILFPIFGKANSRDFPPKKIFNNNVYDKSSVRIAIRSGVRTKQMRHHLQ